MENGTAFVKCLALGSLISVGDCGGFHAVFGTNCEYYGIEVSSGMCPSDGVGSNSSLFNGLPPMHRAMDASKAPNSLPNYERPPVVETVLGVQFDRLPRVTNAHFGKYWSSLGPDWSSLSEAQLLPPQFERFDKEAQWARFMVGFTQDPAARLQIRNAAGDRMIQVQNTRMHFNWLVKEGEKYPRYETIREEFAPLLERFMHFVKQEKLGEFRPNQWEVTYVNQIPKGTVWNNPADWGFFRPLGGLPSVDGLIQGESFSGEWHFVIPENRGRLHIQWAHAVEDKNEKKDGLDNFIRLTLTARGPIAAEEMLLPVVIDGINLGRETIVCTFEKLMTDEANKYWGLRHD